MTQYAIINIETIQKRIEELEKDISLCKPEQQLIRDLLQQEIFIKKEILSQSTPLIPEIEKAFYLGYFHDNSTELKEEKLQNHILNLKLNI